MLATFAGAQLIIPLFVAGAVEKDPSALVTGGVRMVRPVNEPTFLVPDIFAMNYRSVADQKWHSRRHLSIMSDKNGGAVGELDDKPFVRQALGIILQDSLHRRAHRHLRSNQMRILSANRFTVINDAVRRFRSR